jgi:hypothetical protein
VTALAGLRLLVEPEDDLGPRERDILRTLGSTPSSAAGPPVLRIALEPRGPTATPEAGPAEPARVSWSGDRLLLSHEAFEATVDATARSAVVRRHPDDATALVTTLRAALSARLPLEGGVLLHAAALVHGGACLVFFGPSGIGKSTLAERSPWPVVSDELVAVLPRQSGQARRVSSAAFPEPPPDGAATPAPETRLSCLVELAQTPRFRLERLDRRTALRRLLGSIVVPPGPPLWSAALGVAGDLVRETPCYRMGWSLDADPFALLDPILANL